MTGAWRGSLLLVVAATACARTSPTSVRPSPHEVVKRAPPIATSSAPVAATEPTELAEDEECGSGRASAELISSVRDRALDAGKCYTPDVRAEGKEGRVMIAVAVGSGGTVREATVVRDEIGSPSMQECLVAMFRGQLPPPASGCVIINVPLNYSTQESDGDDPSDAPREPPPAMTPEASDGDAAP